MPPSQTNTYAAWSNRIVEALVIGNEDWLNALNGEWRAAFEARGYTPADLHAALDAIMRADADPPNTGRELLGALKRHAGAAQRERLTRDAAREPAKEWSVCEACGNGGLVTVPMLRTEFQGQVTELVVNGEWRPARWNHLGEPIYVTCAVVCRCAAGRRQRDAQAGDRRQMTIERYEDLNPAWRFQMTMMDLRPRADADAATAGDRLPSRDKLLAGIAKAV